ncbi:hypothetical protein Vau01_014260 [Virgisporangium aurantiacum]|uniref:Uncharacterized protein n=1 Tax=Virgisporangium aurantiacum TaxID=175570 RepID=A0A8J3Z222_9ACTN|nr:hypothetical protein Vau01_014260 [Virgisporangium aurantiacum]
MGATTAVYLGAEAARRIRVAQVVVDGHAIDAATERCVRCAVPGPCEARRDALAVLGSYGRLPRRRPGATRPEEIVISAGAPSRSSGPSFGWLGPVTEQREPVTEDSVGGRHRQPGL